MLTDTGESPPVRPAMKEVKVHGHVAITTIGEAMVALYPEGHRPLADARTFGSDVGGAEFNVATSLARLGQELRLLGRFQR